jgi:hypothetical protein
MSNIQPNYRQARETQGRKKPVILVNCKTKVVAFLTNTCKSTTYPVTGSRNVPPVTG